MDRRKLITATLFGVVIGVVYGPIPFEIGDSLIVFEAIILSLSFILLGKGGATYTALINGLIETPFQLGYGAFALLAAVLYGVSIDVFCTLLGVVSEGKVRTKRLIVSLTLSTLLTGVVATYGFIVLGFGTSAPLVDIYLPIVIVGVISGTLGGFVAARLWERNLKKRFQPSDVPRGPQ
ncbi:MAG TPA: hypothetical protein VEJ36_01035 [Nitrososphaerales archaeon]|nr:hypothetical protein [Nitrososphaerales archaeon]